MVTKRIDKILVANRGEIAIRIMRTCRAMGISTVAVFSEADSRAPHVELADEAVCVGAAPAVASYLASERILAAAALTGADAVHPGYGFLAENAAFARACAAAGVTFIGPTPDVIEALGSKREARRIAEQAGVPVLPGRPLDEPRPELYADLGFPLLVKASAGGGGKGMRIVRQPGELAACVESARREARSAFGDDSLLVEKYLERPRHIEIQILADQHGNVMHLFERECSIQRRHQKIIEETPSPAVNEELGAALAQAAMTIARAAGYTTAGTVEFLLDGEHDFYFLEVNTRLQVEHPITEYLTGIDMVREQIRIARGEPLDPGPIARTGAAIECRLYAEDPARGFLPTSGRLFDWHIPPALLSDPGVRVDSGVAAGQDIGIDYDPMLAKLVCHAPTREEAIQKMLLLLRSLSVHGVVNNRDLLVRVLDHEAFRRGDIDTRFLDQHGSALGIAPGSKTARQDSEAALTSAVIAALAAAHEGRRARRSVLPHLEPGFRNNRFDDERVAYVDDRGRAVRAGYRNLGGGKLRVCIDRDSDRDSDSDSSGNSSSGSGSESTSTDVAVEVISYGPPEIVIETSPGWRRRFRVIEVGEDVYVSAPGVAVVLREQPRFPALDPAAGARALAARLSPAGAPGGDRSSAPRAPGSILAPMPGKAVKVLVSPGQHVAAGDTIAILEAMKMEHAIQTPHAGVVSVLAVSEGNRVQIDELIAVITTDG